MKIKGEYIIGGVIGALLLLFIFWTIGYFANALYGYKFDLQSCWAGLSTIGSAGFMALLKWLIDSIWNSDKGTKPE